MGAGIDFKNDLTLSECDHSGSGRGGGLESGRLGEGEDE